MSLKNLGYCAKRIDNITNMLSKYRASSVINDAVSISNPSQMLAFKQELKNCTNSLKATLRKQEEQRINGIKFVKAKNLDEARDYALNVLGLKKFEATDLEIANQFNYSTTKAFNKTRSHDFIPNEFTMEELSKLDIQTNKDLSRAPICAMELLDGTKKVTVSLDFLKNIDTRINKYIDALNRISPASKDNKGFNKLNIISDYIYEHTCNRYYKLYQQGKLTTKAKIDFYSLLTKATENELALLTQDNYVMNFIMKHKGPDVFKSSNEGYLKQVVTHLSDLKNNHGKIASSGRNTRAVGLDSFVLHEDGHIFHYRQGINAQSINNVFTNPEEVDLLKKEISDYAGTAPLEMLAEKIAGTLSGEKYSPAVESIFEKYLGRKIPNID